MAGYTFDLVKLHAQVKDLLPPKARFCIEFEIWDGGASGLSADVEIYHNGERFTGATPDEALAKLRHAYQTQPALEEADLGLVAVPMP